MEGRGREGTKGTRSRREVWVKCEESRSIFQNNREENRLRGLSHASEKKQGLSVPVEQNAFY